MTSIGLGSGSFGTIPKYRRAAASLCSGASRTIDPDGMGFKATYFVTAIVYRAFGNTGGAGGNSTSPACPTGNVKDFATISINSFGTKVDRRYCMYTDLSASNFGVKFAGAPSILGTTGTISLDFSSTMWSWRHGADAGTQFSSFAIDIATPQPQTLLGIRTPIYKLNFSVRYPKKAVPNFATVSDPSVYGLLYAVSTFPTRGLYSAWLVANGSGGGTTWNDLPAR